MDDEDRQQLFFMRRAISLARRGRYLAPPNPWVGSLIVYNRDIIGIGWHEGPGTLHAEEMAIRNSRHGVDFSLCVLYVTLEPCCHIGRRPACTELLIRSGFKKIIVGIEDPDERVSGQGILTLRLAGLEVHSGICQKEIEESLMPYLFQRKNNSPYVVLKTALSVDGCSSAQDGSSQWITDTVCRQDVALQRAASQAILVGIGTVLRDNPSLTVRHPKLKNFTPPLRVVLDSSGRAMGNEIIFDTEVAPTLYVTTKNCSCALIRKIEKQKVEVIIVPETDEGIDLKSLLVILYKKKCVQIFVEGGSRIHGSFLKNGLAHLLLVYYGSCLLGQGGRPFISEGWDIRSITEKYILSLKSVSKIGLGIRVEYFLFFALLKCFFS